MYKGKWNLALFSSNGSVGDFKAVILGSSVNGILGFASSTTALKLASNYCKCLFL